MQLRAEQLEAQLSRSVASVYVIHGDEPLLALEAADAIRAAARRQGCDEREVFSVERGFDWSELAQAGASQSLFGGRKIIELRIPSGKPGAQGAAAIHAYCERLGKENVTLVSLPRLRKDEQNSRWFLALAGAGVVVDICRVERERLPEWVGARLARQGHADLSLVPRPGRVVTKLRSDAVGVMVHAEVQGVEGLALGRRGEQE